MTLDDFIKQPASWIAGSGPDDAIVVSSRIRLARNLARAPFSHRATAEQLEAVVRHCERAFAETEALKYGLFIRIADLSEIDRFLLVERHLISPEHLEQPQARAVAISPEETYSIMVNEEDHLRLQVLQPGFNLDRAWAFADQLDNELAPRLQFAFSSEWGYLTCCPTNAGTGMRASVMMHLPGLVLTKQIDRVLQAITKLGMTARGLYGEGTYAQGNFFQISNQVSLGLPEEDIIDNLKRIIRQLIDQELKARKRLLEQNKEALLDRISRAYGTLKNAYIVNSLETTELLSFVRLGVDLQLINSVSRQALNELLIIVQPAHVQKLEGRALDPNQRDVKRAALIRAKLS